jgi:O-antigen/teichoic acid export membrane protein
LSVARHTSYNIVGSVVPIISALITVPIYLRLMGADRYGVLSIAWILLGYFGLFDLGLGQATAFRIASLRGARAEDRAKTFWAALTVNVGMGMVGGLVLWLSGDFFFGHIMKVAERFRGEALAAMPLLAATVPIATLSGVLIGALQGREQFLRLNLVSTVSTILFQLLPLLLAWRLGPSLPLVLCGAVCARAIGLGALCYLCHVEITRGHPRIFDAKEVRELLGYGFWVTLSSIFAPILVIVDRLVIGALLGAATVTSYVVPYQLAQRIAIVPGALMSALFPRLAASTAEGRRAQTDQATLALAAVLSLPVLVAVFVIGPFLQLWVGHRITTEAAPVGRVLLIGFWANAFALIPHTSLRASGRPRFITVVMLMEIPPYLAALYVGLTTLGLVGSALAFCGRCIVDWVLLSIAARAGVRSVPAVLANLAILVLGAYHASASDWGVTWWLITASLLFVSIAVGWLSLPSEAKTLLLGKLNVLWRGTSRIRRA